ncbi:serine/threonine-protein kinase pim-1-like [Pangasianodon hypophthalmus]|uniref:serine/threonine-protein kinase pim-1-like n=1 Tax=Pangasianodon hypophthalmus TaxID=310915 RepID=UPI00230826DC|nr:serine/threonine-protein kinase pim-1-like [Pangasianodon hypophthalmus]
MYCYCCYPAKQPSCSYSLRARKENPLKRKKMDHEEPEHLLMERPKKRRRTETEQKNVKRQETRTHTMKISKSLQKVPLSPETQSEPSCSYSLRPRKENPLKRKKMDLLHEEPETQLMEMPKKRRRTETEENNVTRQKTGTRPVKRINSSQKGSPSTETQSEASCSPNLKQLRDLINEQPELQPEDMPENFSQRYTIGKRLGRGGYATVYAGVRKSDGKKVAIKYMVKDMAEYYTLPGDTRSLPLEVVLMDLVCKPRCSPYVIKMLEWFETSKGFLLILERPHKCITLYKFCKRQQGRISEDLARIIMWKVVQAAIHCWNNGVLHRDIKEDNILLNPETLELKLIDFGYAFLLKDKPYKAFGGPPIVLPTGWIFPKNIRPESVTVWDLGVLLYTLTCGEKPLYCRTPFFINGLSDACCSLLNWCLQEDIKKRPVLEQILKHDWFRDKTPSRRRRRRRRRKT